MTLIDRFSQVGLVFHQRSEWAAGVAPTESPAAYAPLSKGSIVHWNGPAMGLYTPLDVPSLILSTWRFHTGSSRGWLDIAYNFAMDRFGEIWEGRGDHKWNAASGDNFANTEYVAVELMIGKGDPFPDAVSTSLVKFYRAISMEKNVNYMTYHRFVTPTECPGDDIIRLVENVPNLAQVPTIPSYIGESDKMDHYAHIVGTETYMACYAGVYFPMTLGELRLAQRRGTDMIELTEAELASLKQSGR